MVCHLAVGFVVVDVVEIAILILGEYDGDEGDRKNAEHQRASDETGK